jgi:two-component system, LytTR family, response regulator
VEELELKVLIADDDYGMRLVLKKALDKIKYCKLIGEAEDGNTVLQLYEKLQPDVVFLDVEMPGLTGIECAKRIIDINPKTFIIFATAHGEYMPDAFETYAFDYLIKPFKVERLSKTLERISLLSEKQEDIGIHKIIRYEKGLDKILIKNKEGVSFIDMNDIIIIQREDRSTAIYTSKEAFNTSEALSDLEERLGKGLFFRSHKSYIINLSMISKIYPYGRWTYLVKLKNTEKDALLTHERYEELKNIFNI